MQALRLLPEPPEGFVEYKPPKAASLLSRLYARLVTGFTSGAYAIWVAQSPANPVKVLRMTIWLYERPEFAKNICKQTPDHAALSGFAGTLIELVPGIGDDEAIVWTRGPVTFTSLERPFDCAIITCEAASDLHAAPLPQIVGLHRLVDERIQPAAPSFTIPILVRQLVLGGVLAALIILLADRVGGVAGSPFAQAIKFLGVAAMAYYFSVRPRLIRPGRFRRWFAQGDQNGDIKKALASMGVQIPAGAQK